MSVNCRCGGRYLRIDLIWNRDGTVSDLDSLKATWRCNGCGKLRVQRKRQPRTLTFRIRLNKDEPTKESRAQIQEFLSRYGELLP